MIWFHWYLASYTVIVLLSDWPLLFNILISLSFQGLSLADIVHETGWSISIYKSLSFPFLLYFSVKLESLPGTVSPGLQKPQPLPKITTGKTIKNAVSKCACVAYDFISCCSILERIMESSRALVLIFSFWFYHRPTAWLMSASTCELSELIPSPNLRKFYKLCPCLKILTSVCKTATHAFGEKKHSV